MVMAFLNVYMNPSAGYPSVAEGLGFELNKALYGLKQSSRECSKRWIRSCGRRNLTKDGAVYIFTIQ